MSGSTSSLMTGNTVGVMASENSNAYLLAKLTHMEHLTGELQSVLLRTQSTLLSFSGNSNPGPSEDIIKESSVQIPPSARLDDLCAGLESILKDAHANENMLCDIF